MGRPRKKQDEETVQPEGEPEVDETVTVETPTEEVTAVVDEPADEEGTERVGAVEAEAAAAEEAPVEEAATEVLPPEEPTIETPPAPAPKPKAKKPKPKRAERPKQKKRVAAPRGERKPIVRLPKPERARGRRKERRGVVVSNAMDKTVVVRVETVKPDQRYKKIVRRSSKFHAHDERNEANVGDVVRIVETRPLSKTKSWRVAEVIEAAR
jgi:small subunit ribosomal protein S17